MHAWLRQGGTMGADGTLTAACLARLELFNRRWSARKAQFARYCGGNWWGRGTIVSPEYRGWYNTWLPADEFQRELLRLAEDFLRDDTLVPSVLRGNSDAFMSLPDVWATLVDAYAGRVSFGADELLGLFCNFADPSRMGTAAGRYPAQLQRLAHLARGRSSLRLLDLGCGVGLGTYELAEVCLQSGVTAVQAQGVTAEGLEVWMAKHRCLPHDETRQRQFRQFSCGPKMAFALGKAESYGDGTAYDIIVCNGLAGGRFMSTAHSLADFLENCRRQLSADGVILLSNHFHEGFEPGCRRLMALARERGWRIAGNWRNLELSL